MNEWELVWGQQTFILQIIQFLVLSLVLYAASFTHWSYLPGYLSIYLSSSYLPTYLFIYVLMLVTWEKAIGCWSFITYKLPGPNRIEYFLFYTHPILGFSVLLPSQLHHSAHISISTCLHLSCRALCDVSSLYLLSSPPLRISLPCDLC